MRNALLDVNLDDPAVQSDMKHWPFKVVQSEDGRPKIQVQVKGDLKNFPRV
jgi:molecular chaperone DnaK (HSP70)